LLDQTNKERRLPADSSVYVAIDEETARPKSIQMFALLRIFLKGNTLFDINPDLLFQV